MEMPIDMQNQAMGYDRTATMFSPEGHILQAEYAEKTVRLGPSSTGMVCSDGVFILADKRITDNLIKMASATRIHEIDEHLIASAAGIVSDGRVLIEKARLSGQQHRITYDSPIEPELIIKEICDAKQQFTQYGGARPFGVSLLIAGINNKKPELFTSDVTGNYFSYNANAIGENDDKIKEKLRESYDSKLTIKHGVKLALKIYKELNGKNFDIAKFELVYIEKDGGLKRLEGSAIEDY